jgi:hypothetical protein
MKFNKKLQDAIERHLPLSWEERRRQSTLVLMATTAQNENGSNRSRACMKCDNLGRVIEISEAVIEAGEPVAFTAIDDIMRDIRHWEYGWKPEMWEKFQALKDRARKAPGVLKSPQW